MGFRNPRTKVTCASCGKVFTLGASEYRRRLGKSKSKKLYCSPQCNGAACRVVRE
jgi:hypothetical protein